MARTGLPPTISTVLSPLRILVKMARLQDSLLALLLMTFPRAEQGFGHLPRLPTTPHMLFQTQLSLQQCAVSFWRPLWKSGFTLSIFLQLNPTVN